MKNKEIKFRVWDVIGKRMYLWPILIDTYIGDNNTILQQYTGLKDKNEKEIYEGDIISYTPFNSSGYENTIVFVPYLNKYHWFAELGEMLLEDNKCHIDIIGNVYENPTLKETTHRYEIN